jgi:hypothetical protein
MFVYQDSNEFLWTYYFYCDIKLSENIEIHRAYVHP